MGEPNKLEQPGARFAMFRRVSRSAGIMLVPYICWVTFAAVLNYAIWTLN